MPHSIIDSHVANVPLAVIDFETTGLYPGEDRVVEVAIVRMDPGDQPRVVVDTLVNPDRPMAATQIHGITDDKVADAPMFNDVAPQILEALSGCVVAAYNVYFDIKFLEYELSQVVSLDLPPHLCLMYMRPLLGLGCKCPLMDACNDHGIKLNNAHAASADAMAAAELWPLYMNAMNNLGITTYRDIQNAKKHKFLSSLSNPTID